ncbi:MAG: hypothetical protein ACRD2L_10710, partial [Terriglobia bacterium]
MSSFFRALLKKGERNKKGTSCGAGGVDLDASVRVGWQFFSDEEIVMVRITLKSFVAFLSGGLLFFLVGFPLAYGQSSSAVLSPPQDDPTHWQVDQLKIPNIFARQVIELPGERSRLLAEKAQLAQQLREEQQTLATKEHVLRRTEADNEALAQEVAAVDQWRLSAHVLGIMFLGVLGWGLLINKDRAERGRQVATLRQENTALEVTKEKYRLAAAQLELRYQKLYSGRSEKPSQLATEGAILLTQTFETGCTQLEQC